MRVLPSVRLLTGQLFDICRQTQAEPNTRKVDEAQDVTGLQHKLYTLGNKCDRYKEKRTMRSFALNCSCNLHSLHGMVVSSRAPATVRMSPK